MYIKDKRKKTFNAIWGILDHGPGWDHKSVDFKLIFAFELNVCDLEDDLNDFSFHIIFTIGRYVPNLKKNISSSCR